MVHLGPRYMVSGARDNPTPETTLASVYMWKRLVSEVIIYSHLSFGHIWALQYDRTCVTHKNPVYVFAHHDSPKAQWLESSNRYSGRSWVRLPLGNSENLFPSIWLESTSSFIFTLSKSQFHLSFTCIARQFICCRVNVRCAGHINLHDFGLKNHPILYLFVDSGIKQTRFDHKNVYCFVQCSATIKTQHCLTT